jgi:carotenoid 1,2-hydratase
MMQVIIDANGDLPMKSSAPGTYEWWYFDAIDEEQELAITIILFDGMPMSPYWLDSLPQAKSEDYSGYAISLYRKGKKIAGFVHHTEYHSIHVDDGLEIHMGDVSMKKHGDSYTICIDTRFADSPNALIGELVFHNQSAIASHDSLGEGNHCWRLIVPQCSVEGQLTLIQYEDIHTEWTCSGHGYHDCNSGNDSLDADYDDWYWGRCDIGKKQSIIYYHYPASSRNEAMSIAFLADEEYGIRQLSTCSIELLNMRMTTSLMNIASTLIIRGYIDESPIEILINIESILEFGPFYYRYLIEAQSGDLKSPKKGIAEYFNAKRLKSRIVRTMIKTPIQRV